MKRILLSILLLVLVKVSVSAQPIAIPYSHGFEASADAENRNWICGSSTIKPGQTLFDTWTIGSLAAREGNKSLYATGRTDSLSMHSTDNLSIAYRKIEFPIAGTYDIVFDWRNDFGNTANSGLYVSFYKPGNMPNPDPVVNLTQSTDYTKAIAPTLVGMSANIQSFTFYDDKGKPYSKNVLSGDGRWQTSSFTTKSVKAGEVWYLVFIQKNAEQPGNEGMPSVIDNIQIAQHTALPQNIDVSHDCTDLIITWDNSVGDFYDIAYRQSHEIQYTTLFRQKVGQVGNRYEFRIPGLSEGVYDVMITSTEIRSGGEEVMGIAMPAHYNVAMCETMHCFDYLDLYAGNVQCYRGQLSQSKPGEQWEPQPVKTKPVDNGYYDPYSLHTVHFMPGETDPHTGGRSGHAPLKTKPDGELASVRIGNWLAQESKQATKEYAAVEYTVEVKESTPIILLKYAIVYQAPGHDKNKPAGAVREDPKFSLQVLNMQGEPLEDFEVCGKAEFYAEVDKEGSGWVTEDDKSTTNDIPVVWKDWTTMGINLRNLPAGTKYKIRISVQDCAQGAHWAYGYFALGCASGEIVGMACGEADIIPLEAPAGFRYRWYSEKDPSTTLLEGEEEARVYNAPAGTGEVFHVECSYIDDGTDYKDCSFDLDSRAVPSIPHSEFEFVHRPADCKNLFMLINRSHSDIIDGAGNRVCDKDDVTGKYKKPTSDVKWEIDGTELDPQNLTAPVDSIHGDTLFCSAHAGGKTFAIKLTATIPGPTEASGECLEIYEQPVEVPNIIANGGKEELTLCEGDVFNHSCPEIPATISRDTTIIATGCTNEYGCEYTTEYRIKMNPIYNIVIDTTICYGSAYEYRDADGNLLESLSEANTYTYKLKTKGCNCDSTIFILLKVHPEIVFSCTTVRETTPGSGAIEFDPPLPADHIYTINGETNGALTGLAAGDYEIVVVNTETGCSSAPQTYTVEPECLSLDIDEVTPYTVCADDEVVEIPFELLSGILTTYSVSFDQKALDAGFVAVSGKQFVDGEPISFEKRPAATRVDRYQAVITAADVVCNDRTYNVSIDVNYPADIVAQKWNDVLAVVNDNPYGQYSFTAFQWYRDGTPLAGETASYLYIPDGGVLDTAASYHVDITRSDDGLCIASCPVRPYYKNPDGFAPNPILNFEQAARRLNISNITSPVRVAIFDVAGILWSDVRITDASFSLDLSHYPSGVYLVRLYHNTIASTYKIIIRR